MNYDEPGDVCQRLVRAEPGQILDPEVGQGSALAVVAVLQYQHQPWAVEVSGDSGLTRKTTLQRKRFKFKRSLLALAAYQQEHGAAGAVVLPARPVPLLPHPGVGDTEM